MRDTKNLLADPAVDLLVESVVATADQLPAGLLRVIETNSGGATNPIQTTNVANLASDRDPTSADRIAEKASEKAWDEYEAEQTEKH